MRICTTCHMSNRTVGAVMATGTGAIEVLAPPTLDDLVRVTGVPPQKLDEPCCDEHLRTISPELTRWQELAPHLVLKEAEVEAIEMEAKTVNEKRLKALRKWKNKYGFKATYRVLIEALLKCHMADHAEKVCHLVVVVPRDDSKPVSAASSDNAPIYNYPLKSLTTCNENPCNENPVQKLFDEICELERKYDDLVDEVEDSLTKGGTDLSHLKNRIIRLPVSMKYSHWKLLEPEATAAIENTTNIRGLITLLHNKHWDFLNCELLCHIVNRFCDPKTKQSTEKYLDELRKFRVQTKLKDLIQWSGTRYARSILPVEKELVLKMGDEWEERTLEDLEQFRIELSRRCFINSYAMQFRKGEPGCIVVTFALPTSVDITALCLQDLQEFLEQQHVLRVAGSILNTTITIYQSCKPVTDLSPPAVPPPVPPPQNNAGPGERTKCLIPGCKSYGTAESRYYCSKCFNDNMEKILDEEVGFAAAASPDLVPGQVQLPVATLISPQASPQGTEELRKDAADFQPPVKMLCKAASCPFKAVPELNNFCPDCYEEHYGKQSQDSTHDHLDVMILNMLVTWKDRKVSQLQKQNAELLDEIKQHKSTTQRHQQENEQLLQEKEQLQEQLRQQTASNRQLKKRLDEALMQTSQAVDFWKVPPQEVHVFKGEILGRGAWGYVAKGRFRGQRVAVKCLHQAILDPRNVERVHREIRTMAQVRHPNLVLFIAAVYDEGRAPMIVTELLDTNLRQAYQRVHMTSSNKLSIFRDVSCALNYLHCHREPIIHRDVSAPNVLLEALANDTWKAKVSDFGSAKLAALSHTLGGDIIYSAPETFPQSYNPHMIPLPQTPKIDVYSFGILLCEVTAGQFPDPERYSTLVKEVQQAWPSMYSLIISCTKYHPNERPSMAQVLDKLDRMPQP